MLLNSAWECPYTVIEDTCELSFRIIRTTWRWSQCWLLGLGEPRWEWLLMIWGGNSVLYCKRLFCIPNVQNCAVLAALNSINYISLLIPGCFVLGMYKFQPQRVGRFELNWDMMFIEEGSQESISHCESFLITPICTCFFPPNYRGAASLSFRGINILM